MQVVAGVHADLHEEKAAEHCSNGANDNAKCINVYSIYFTKQTVRIQREDRSQEAVVTHVPVFFINLIGVGSIFMLPEIFYIGPIRKPVIIASGSDLADDEK